MNLLSFNYWLNSRPGLPEPILIKILGIFLGLLAIFMFISFIAKNRPGVYMRIWAKMQTFFLTNLALGFMMLFFVYEAIPFLSTRVLFLVWGVSMIAWFVFIYKDMSKIPAMKQKRAEEAEFKKYIP